MHMMAVSADPKQPAVERPDRRKSMVKFDDFGRTNEGEIERPEKHDRPLPVKVCGVHDAELLPGLRRHTGFHREVGKLFANSEQLRHTTIHSCGCALRIPPPSRLKPTARRRSRGVRRKTPCWLGLTTCV